MACSMLDGAAGGALSGAAGSELGSAAGVNAGDLCGGVDWIMAGGVSNSHCFNAGRYTVIHALTGGLEPSNPCSFKDVADKFVGKDGGFAWDKPESCFHEIQVW